MARVIRSALLAALCGLLALPALASAGTLVEDSTDVKFPEVRKVAGKDFKCLGTGVRKVVIFKVYAAAFCIDAAEADGILKGAVAAHANGKTGEDLAELLEDSDAFNKKLYANSADKLVVMHMVRDVGKEKLASAFQESLGKVLPKASVDKLGALMTVDAKDGMEVLFYTQGNTVFVDMGGDVKQVDDDKIAAAVWSVWLGPDTVTPGMREDIAVRASK
ncbi:MAG: chalcone isomerase family protein [Deltaproteobacteria bacterium]|nr:chalcone isomerase family protein [Deltaproteobacteria bacterium]